MQKPLELLGLHEFQMELAKVLYEYSQFNSRYKYGRIINIFFDKSQYFPILVFRLINHYCEVVDVRFYPKDHKDEKIFTVKELDIIGYDIGFKPLSGANDNGNIFKNITINRETRGTINRASQVFSKLIDVCIDKDSIEKNKGLTSDFNEFIGLTES